MEEKIRASLGDPSIIADFGGTAVDRKATELKDFLQHEMFRQRTIEIIKEFIGHADFTDKIKNIVGDEIENRKLKGYKNVLFIVLRYAATLGVGIAIGFITHGHVNNSSSTSQSHQQTTTSQIKP